jgi:hypothetical protein
MPIYEFECEDCLIKEDHFFEIPKRDTPVYCEGCGFMMKRLPGGHGMLYFEEGRGRVHIGLSDKPITSYAQRERLMRQMGVVEGNGTVPQSILKAGPKSPAMQQYLSKDKRGRWL